MISLKRIGNSVLKFALQYKRNKICLNDKTKRLSFNFTTIKSDKNPNQMPQQLKKLMQQQKTKRKTKQIPILKDISQLKSIFQLPNICKKMNFMSKQHRQIAIRYLLSAVYQRKIPVQALKEKMIDVLLVEYSNLKLETEIYQINHLVNSIHKAKIDLSNIQQAIAKAQKQKQIQQLFNKINDLYMNAFSVTLKNVSAQHLAKSKSTLYKHFAQYNSQQLFNPKIVQKSFPSFQSNTKILKKSRQFISQSLRYHKDIIMVQYKKLQNDQMKTLKQQDSERFQIKINAIKQNIRKIVESMGECLYLYFKIINKEHKVMKNASEHLNRKIQLLSLIQTYIPLYSIIPGNFFFTNKHLGIKQLSIMYHKLYKIKIQAKFTTQEPKDQQHAKKKVKQALQDYSIVYRQCQNCLEQGIKMDKFPHIKQISTLMISIKYMIGRNLKKNQTELKNNLAVVAKGIIDKMKDDYKKPIQYYLLEFIKQILQVK